MREPGTGSSSSEGEVGISGVPAQRSERDVRTDEGDSDEVIVSENDPIILLGYN